METLFFTEYKWFQNDLDLKNSFEMRDFYEVAAGKIKFTFCGFLYKENTLITVFPKGFNYDPANAKETVESARLLYKVFVKYNRRTILKSDNPEYGKNRESHNFLSVAGAVVKDYVHHGLIKDKIKVRKTNGAGRTNWSRTFKKIKPILFEDSLFYMDVINEKNLNLISSELISIHEHVLSDVTEKAGWLLNFSYKSPMKIKVHGIKALSILKKAMNITFNQSLLTRLNLLYQYLKLTYSMDDHHSFQFLYTFNFQNIWEDICKVTFDDNKTLRAQVPKYEWTSENKEFLTNTLLPDVIASFPQNLVVIIDAKYYPESDAAHGYKLPGSGDISKQFMYQLALEKLKPFDSAHIDNVFLIPGKSDYPFVKELGKVGLPNFEYKITALIVDIKHAMTCYLSGNTDLKDFLYETYKLRLDLALRMYESAEYTFESIKNETNIDSATLYKYICRIEK